MRWLIQTLSTLWIQNNDGQHLLTAFFVSVPPPSAPGSPGSMGEPLLYLEPQLISRFPKEPGKEILAFRLPTTNIINFWAPHAQNAWLLMGSLGMPAKSALHIQRFINNTSNLSSWMGKFCQYLIKAKCAVALCMPTSVLSLSSAVSRKLVQQAGMGLMKSGGGREFCIFSLEFGLQTSSRGPSPPDGAVKIKRASSSESVCPIFRYPSEHCALSETRPVPSELSWVPLIFQSRMQTQRNIKQWH